MKHFVCRMFHSSNFISKLGTFDKQVRAVLKHHDLRRFLRFLEVQRETVKHGPEVICDLIKDQWHFNVNLEIDVIGSNL